MACNRHEPDWSQHCGDLWREHVGRTCGYDICERLGAGSPRSARAWAALIRQIGGRTMADVITFVHGPAIPPRCAGRGDIVRKGWAIGICRGEDAEFFGGDFIPMAQVDQAWAVQGHGDG